MSDEKSKPYEMTADQRAMYTGISNLLIAEKNLRWSRSQMLVAINVAGAALLQPTVETPEAHVVIGCIGILVCFFWGWLNWRTQRYVVFWQKCLEAMESPKEHLAKSRVFSGGEWKEVDGFPSFYHVLYLLPTLFFAVWSLVVFLAFYPEFFMKLLRGAS